MAKIKNLAYIDLRNFTPEALKKIDSITDVALVILPEHPSAEFMEAYASIEKNDVISESNVSGKACVFNGLSVLSKDILSKDSIVVCNGMTVIRDIPKDMNIRLIVNGTLIKSPTAFVELVEINGAIHTIDDDAKIIKSVASFEIDKNFVDSIPDKVAIICCGKIYITDDVSKDLLQKKSISFYDVGKIISRKELHGYIRVNSNNVGKICTYDEIQENKKRGLKRMFGWK